METSQSGGQAVHKHPGSLEARLPYWSFLKLLLIIAFSILNLLYSLKYFNWHIDLCYLKGAEITKVKMFIDEMRITENELGDAL